MFTSSSNEDLFEDDRDTINKKQNQNNCKSKCSKCTVEMSFRLKDIDQDISNLSLENILNELKKHGHPKYKKVNGKNRTKIEAKEELKYHLLNYHRKKITK